MRLDDMSRTEIEFLIDEWIHKERDRQILKRRLLDGICYEPLAEEFDLSVRQVKNIVYRAEDKLFRKVH
jgi:DNA-directed RNA polymerase specialized sigma24 family protein